MPRFLIMRLDGPMQAWGGHTFEDFRPSHLFPTRSGLLGLVAACLGIARDDHARQEALATSLDFTVRADTGALRPEAGDVVQPKRTVRLTDFHTVLAARRVDGKPSPYPVVSRREYLFDVSFTVAVAERAGATVGLDEVAAGLRRPVFTPFLGRRACPLARPLFEDFVDGDTARDALEKVAPQGGTVYAESATLRSEQQLLLRDVPMHRRHRQFGTRKVYIHAGKGEA